MKTRDAHISAYTDNQLYKWNYKLSSYLLSDTLDENILQLGSV